MPALTASSRLPLVLAALLVGGCAKAPSGVAEPPPAGEVQTVPVVGAGVTVEQAHRDLGRVCRPVTELQAVYTVTNGDAVPHRLGVGNKSCGCAAVDVPAAPLEPGRSAAVTVVWRPANALGPAAFWADLTVDGGRPAGVKLTGRCDITDVLDVTPLPLVFEGIKPGDSTVVQLSVALQDGEERLDATGLALATGREDGLVAAGRPVQAGPRSATVPLIVRGRDEPGTVSGLLAVRYGARRVDLPYTLTFTGQLQAAPSVLVLRAGEGASGEVRLTPVGGPTPVVRSVTADHAELVRCDPKGPDGDALVYRVQVRPGSSLSENYITGAITFRAEGIKSPVSVKYIVLP